MNPIRQHPVLGVALTAEDVHTTYKGSEAATLVSNLVEHAASVIGPPWPRSLSMLSMRSTAQET